MFWGRRSDFLSGVGRPFRRQESLCQGTDRELKVAALAEHGSDAKPALAGAASLSSRSVAANLALARPRFAYLDQEPPARAPGQGTSCRSTGRPMAIRRRSPALRSEATPERSNSAPFWWIECGQRRLVAEAETRVAGFPSEGRAVRHAPRGGGQGAPRAA